MGRTVKERGRQPAPRPVEKIEVSQSHVGRRLVLFFLCLAVAVGSIGYGVYGLMSVDAGWTTVEAGGTGLSCAKDFTFEYLVTESGPAGRDQLRNAQNLYSRLASQAYQLFNADAAADDENMHNIWYINAHPNEEITVEPVLYEAFRQLESAGSRSVYLGPVYEVYTDLFFAQDALEARHLDPWQDPEMEAFCQEVADFAADPAQVNVELLGDNRLCLRVSEEYMRYAGECEFSRFVDFYRQKNAFVMDYFVDEMTKAGLRSGVLSTVDGFMRTLPDTKSGSVVNLTDWNGQQVIAAAQVRFDRPVSFAYLRAFPSGEEDENWYQDVGDKTFRHPYIDPSDGKCKAGANAMAVYAERASCVQLLLAAEPVFIREDFAPQAPQGFQAVYLRDKTLFCTDPELPLDNLYSGYVRKNV